MDQASSMWANSLTASDRVLVTGANGWFGRTALKLISSSEAKILPVGSKENQLLIGDQKFEIKPWSDLEVQRFEPTLFIDCAFLTRERISEFGFNQYVEVNRNLIARSIQVLQMASVSRAIVISSGAAVKFRENNTSTLENDPYGALKAEHECRLEEIASSVEPGIVISRAWSVTGSLNTKPHLFAFSNFIDQAKKGSIQISSKGRVFRRYVSVEDLITLSLLRTVTGNLYALDSGGEVIELNELAELIFKLIGAEPKIVRELKPFIADDLYYSNNQTWNESIKEYSYNPQSLEEQIKVLLSSVQPNY